MAIKGLTPQLGERGKIKIGGLGDERKKTSGQGTYMLPVKYDHFVITTMQRDAAGRFMPDDALMKMVNPGGAKLVELPVRLLYDDIDLNFMTRYSAYQGSRCWCSGDGEEAQRLTGENGKYAPVPCPCERLAQDYKGQPRCKPLGTLQVLLEGVDRVGGVWKFRTTSWNTVNAILSSLALIKTLTGGPLAGIPLTLVLSPKTVQTPDGKSMVAFIVSIEFRGPEQQLAEIGYEIALRRIKRQVKMETVEVEARKLLMLPHMEPAPEQADTAAEFYPDPEADKPASPGPAHGKKKSPATQSPGPEPEHQAEAGTQSQDPGNGTGQEGESQPQAITLPALMELAKKPDGMVDLPLPLVTTKGVHIGRWLDWGPNLSGEMQVSLEFVDNLKEVANGLTPEVIEKAFNEAGIVLKVVTAADAMQEGKERILRAETNLSLEELAKEDHDLELRLEHLNLTGKASRKSLF